MTILFPGGANVVLISVERTVVTLLGVWLIAVCACRTLITHPLASST